MPTFFTRRGDDGLTGLSGEGRVSKSDVRIEVLGALDEATAALGMGRAFCRAPESAGLILSIQRDLYRLMAEVAATPENAEKFRTISGEHVAWLEAQTEALGVTPPRDFIAPGDSPAGAVLDLARAIVRRAERRLAGLLERDGISNRELLAYLNRLSSFLFVLELYENQFAGQVRPTLAKN